MKLSWKALTAPHEVTVVMTAQSTERAIPKRTSLPSKLPPAWSAEADWSTPSAANSGLPRCSIGSASASPITTITNDAAQSVQPWRVSPTIRPNV